MSSSHVNLPPTLPREQARALALGVDIIVATPGRLIDFVGRGIVSLELTRFLVLDEVNHGSLHTYYLLLTTYDSRLTTHDSLLTTYYSLLALSAFCFLLAACCLLLAPYYSLRTTYYSYYSLISRARGGAPAVIETLIAPCRVLLLPTVSCCFLLLPAASCCFLLVLATSCCFLLLPAGSCCFLLLLPGSL